MIFRIWADDKEVNAFFILLLKKNKYVENLFCALLQKYPSEIYATQYSKMDIKCFINFKVLKILLYMLVIHINY